MKKTIFSFLTAAVILIGNVSFGQELRRIASFGAAISDLKDSSQVALKLPSSSGALINKVIPGSSAEKAGFTVNDFVVSMDGESILNASHFIELLKKHQGGDKVKIGFYRKGKLQATAMTLLPKQMETSDAYDIVYSSVMSGTNQLRTIITKPKGGGIHPAVLLIGGVGCYSIDNIAASEILSIKMWSDSLTRNGFVTIRVEKTGMGDSKGIPCKECDFNTEKQNFLSGLEQLKSLPYVDKEHVFIAGFSMGGVIAPLIAEQVAVKGIIVYGTAGRNWLEYELENAHRQALLDDMSADSLERYMRVEFVRLYSLFIEKKTPAEIIKEHPETKGHLMEYPMRVEYFQQVADINIREMWMHTKAKVLAMHGSSDFVSSAAEHKLIAEIVNQYNPGNGVYAEIAGCDHWGLAAENEKISKAGTQTGLNFLPITTTIKWLKANS
jgi:uncharacterized protein